MKTIDFDKENKYKVGEMVVERIFPNKKLKISQYKGNLYYCKPLENPNLNEIVYFEHDLMAESINTPGSTST